MLREREGGRAGGRARVRVINEGFVSQSGFHYTDWGESAGSQPQSSQLIPTAAGRLREFTDRAIFRQRQVDWLTSDDDDVDPDSSLQDCSAVSSNQLLSTFRSTVIKTDTRGSASYLRRLGLQQRRCDKLKSRHFNLLGCYRNMTATGRVLRCSSSQTHLALQFCLICAACLSI